MYKSIHVAPVQEACLFAMLRLVAELDGDDGDAGTPKGVVERVKEMRMGTGRYMFRVCFVLFLSAP